MFIRSQYNVLLHIFNEEKRIWKVSRINVIKLNNEFCSLSILPFVKEKKRKPANKSRSISKMVREQTVCYGYGGAGTGSCERSMKYTTAAATRQKSIKLIYCINLMSIE